MVRTTRDRNCHVNDLSSFCFLVDLILRELNVTSDGRVFYDHLVHMLTQPLAGRR